MIRDFGPFFEQHLGRIRWKPDGNGTTRCPFHHDRQPSLSIHRYKGTWKCFAGCGAGAVRDFCRRLGVTPPWRPT